MPRLTALRLAPAANRTNRWTNDFRRFRVEFMQQDRPQELSQTIYFYENSRVLCCSGT